MRHDALGLLAQLANHRRTLGVALVGLCNVLAHRIGHLRPLAEPTALDIACQVLAVRGQLLQQQQDRRRVERHDDREGLLDQDAGQRVVAAVAVLDLRGDLGNDRPGRQLRRPGDAGPVRALRSARQVRARRPARFARVREVGDHAPGLGLRVIGEHLGPVDPERLRLGLDEAAGDRDVLGLRRRPRRQKEALDPLGGEHALLATDDAVHPGAQSFIAAHRHRVAVVGHARDARKPVLATEHGIFVGLGDALQQDVALHRFGLREASKEGLGFLRSEHDATARP